MPLTGNLSLTANSRLVGVGDLGTPTAPATIAEAISYASGTGAGQIDRVFADTRTLAASANEDLDLAGVLTDALGATITLARVKALIVRAAPGNTNDVLVGGAAATQFLSWTGGAAHQVRLRPDAFFAIAAGPSDAVGYVTAAGASDFLRITNSAGTTPVTYDIMILGCSA